MVAAAGTFVVTKEKSTMTTKIKLIATIKIWLVIYPSITLFFYFLGQPLAILPLYQRTFLLTIVLVPWIVFVGVPLVDVALRTFSTDTNKK